MVVLDIYEWWWQDLTLLAAAAEVVPVVIVTLFGFATPYKFTLYGHMSGISYIQGYFYTLAQRV